MKPVLLSITFLALTWSIFFVSEINGAEGGQTEGSWRSMAEFGGCIDENQICAEWFQPGDPMDGTLCCVDQNDMWSHSFSTCQGPPEGRGGPRNPL